MSVRGLFIMVGLAIAFVFLAIGCEPQKVQVEGGQTHEVKIHHDPQKTDVWIHRDRKRRSNP